MTLWHSLRGLCRLLSRTMCTPMHVCMYACMHVCMYACMYVEICIYMHPRTMCTLTHTHAYIYAHTHPHNMHTFALPNSTLRKARKACCARRSAGVSMRASCPSPLWLPACDSWGWFITLRNTRKVRGWREARPLSNKVPAEGAASACVSGTLPLPLRYVDGL